LAAFLIASRIAIGSSDWVRSSSDAPPTSGQLLRFQLGPA
jgi:hypothetical protein